MFVFGCSHASRPTRTFSPLITVALLVSAAVTATACARAGAPPGTDATTVTRVIDGDTIVVASVGDDRHDVHVRLIGIDTPETKKPNTPVECFGPEASARLHELLPEGTEVRLEVDAEAQDTYGRALAYVYRSADDLFVNEAMVADGFAAQLTIPPNIAHAEAFTAAAADARTQRRGLWGTCPTAHSPAR